MVPNAQDYAWSLMNIPYLVKVLSNNFLTKQDIQQINQHVVVSLADVEVYQSAAEHLFHPSAVGYMKSHISNLTYKHSFLQGGEYAQPMGLMKAINICAGQVMQSFGASALSHQVSSSNVRELNELVRAKCYESLLKQTVDKINLNHDGVGKVCTKSWLAVIVCILILVNLVLILRVNEVVVHRKYRAFVGDTLASIRNAVINAWQWLHKFSWASYCGTLFFMPFWMLKKFHISKSLIATMKTIRIGQGSLSGPKNNENSPYWTRFYTSLTKFMTAATKPQSLSQIVGNKNHLNYDPGNLRETKLSVTRAAKPAAEGSLASRPCSTQSARQRLVGAYRRRELVDLYKRSKRHIQEKGSSERMIRVMTMDTMCKELGLGLHNQAQGTTKP